MKIYNAYLFLSMLVMMNCSGKTIELGSTSHFGTGELIEENNTEFIKIHSLKKNDNTFIGDIYVKFINDSVFTDLNVINESDTLYSIKRNVFLNKVGNDIDVFSDGFYGYIFVLKKNDYFVLSYLRNNGLNVSDDITIEWSYIKNILESQKLP